MTKDFNFKEYSQLDVSGKSAFVNDFILDEFSKRFFDGVKVSQETFNKIISQDRKIRKWYKILKTELDALQRVPNYALLDGAPKEVHSIILAEAEKLTKSNQELEKETQKVVDEYKEKMAKIDEKRIKEHKQYSKYTLVSTLTIDDVPLNLKRKLFTETDKDKIIVYRKDVVSEFKRMCFENLLKNGGSFSSDFEDPFSVK